MKTEDDITRLYRRHLADAEMDVRDGFWQALQADLDKAEGRAVPLRRRWFPRVAAAASIALVLAGASAAFWCLSQRPDVKEAISAPRRERGHGAGGFHSACARSAG